MPHSGGLILAGKAVWVLNRCLPIENADYCMLGIEWVWLRLQLCLLWMKALEFSFGVRALTELKTWCRYMLKVVSGGKKNQAIKG